MGESFIEQELQTHLARNEALVALFIENGGDVEEHREIDFYFYAGDEVAAKELAASVEALGLEDPLVEEEIGEDEHVRWSVRAVKTTSVAAVTDPIFVERVVRLAAEHLAELDGWGTAV